MSCSICSGRRLRLRPGTRAAEASRCDCVEVCPECGDSGWVHRRAADGTTSAGRCGCLVLDRRIRLLSEATLPARYHDCTLENFERRLTNTDYVLDYLEQRWLGRFREGQNGLLFVGLAGVGKTHLAVAVLRRVIEDHGVAGRFVEWFELLSAIRASYGTPGGERTVLAPLTEGPVLVVDEMGKGKGSEWELSVLDQLIGGRYNRNLTTLFTTNYPLRAGDRIHEQGRPVQLAGLDDVKRLLGEAPLEERVGARIYSRVLDMCKPFVLRGAPDYRLQRVRDSGEPPRS